jgi:hypothetical protein
MLMDPKKKKERHVTIRKGSKQLAGSEPGTHVLCRAQKKEHRGTNQKTERKSVCEGAHVLKDGQVRVMKASE